MMYCGTVCPAGLKHGVEHYCCVTCRELFRDSDNDKEGLCHNPRFNTCRHEDGNGGCIINFQITGEKALEKGFEVLGKNPYTPSDLPKDHPLYGRLVDKIDFCTNCGRRSRVRERFCADCGTLTIKRHYHSGCGAIVGKLGRISYTQRLGKALNKSPYFVPKGWQKAMKIIEFPKMCNGTFRMGNIIKIEMPCREMVYQNMYYCPQCGKKTGFKWTP